MAPNRKGKGAHSQNNSNRKSNNSSNANTDHVSTFSKQQKEQRKVAAQINELQDIWDEFQGATSPQLYSSWKEIAAAGLFLLSLGLVAVLVGVAAGMTISIHYIDDPFQPFDSNGMVISNQHRVTTYDKEMLTRNVMPNSTSIDLGNLQKTVMKGERTLVSIVDRNEGIGPAANTNGDTGVFRDIFYAKPSTKPTLCPDGQSIGFSNWEVLGTAVRELNILSMEKALRWSEYFSTIHSHEFGAFEDDALYYEDSYYFPICPGLTLKGRRGPLFVNSENVLIECDGCTIDVPGSHFSFGSRAKNVLVRGITFRGQHRSSVSFHHHGADVTFEDCLWMDGWRKAKYGPVADVNSSSVVNFLRCKVGDRQAAPLHRHSLFGMRNVYSYLMSFRS